MNYILNPQSIYNETGPVDDNLDVASNQLGPCRSNTAITRTIFSFSAAFPQSVFAIAHLIIFSDK